MAVCWSKCRSRRLKWGVLCFENQPGSSCVPLSGRTTWLCHFKGSYLDKTYKLYVCVGSSYVTRFCRDKMQSSGKTSRQTAARHGCVSGCCADMWKRAKWGIGAHALCQCCGLAAWFRKILLRPFSSGVRHMARIKYLELLLRQALRDELLEIVYDIQ